MSLLYKDEKDVTYNVEINAHPRAGIPYGKIRLLFTCDGGKFDGEESLAEHEVTVLEMLTALNEWAKKQDIKELER